MKKNIFLPILAAVLLITAAAFWFLRPDPVVLSVIASANNEQTLIQITAKSVQQVELGTDLKRPSVKAVCGRWAIIVSQDEKNSPVLNHFYDLHNMKKPLYSTTGELTFERITPEGLFVYRTDALYCFDGRENHRLCELGSGLGNPQVVDNTVYFTKDDQTYACDLPNGEPYPAPNGVAIWYENVITHEGRTYMLDARSRTAGEGRDLYRIVDGAETLIAENVVGQYQADPVSGTVVHRRANAEHENIWYLSVMGKSMELFAASQIQATVSTTGTAYVLHGGQLLALQGLTEPEILAENVESFRVLAAEDGTEKVWIHRVGGQLLLYTGSETQLIAEEVEQLYLPTEITSYYAPDKIATPGGVYRELSDTVLYTRSTGLNASALYRWQDGKETKLPEDYLLYPAALAENGEVLVTANGRWLIVGEDRVQELERPEGASLIFVSGIRYTQINEIPLALVTYDT